jgi:para-nitrobenzyl esterase
MHRIFAALFGAVSLWVVASAPSAAAPPPLTVAINSCKAKSSMVTGFVGNFQGFSTGPMRQFLKIPYAAPPTGQNRWRPPQAVTCWSNTITLPTFNYVSCPQGTGSFSTEDCLYLNVFTSPTGTVQKQPVMVFIHGGGLTSGAATFAANPADLVKQGIVVVSINYRLGALGFLAHPALDSVAKKQTGNYGILDQQAALKWVKANIAAFGGDPANVTIFGQSAGGLSTHVHLVSPLSVGLFHKVIAQSAASYYQPTLLSTAEGQGQSFASAAGCTNQSAACLRGLDMATILAHQNVLGQSTALLRVDNVVLKETIASALMAGHFPKIPIINGTNHDEMRFHLETNPSLGTGSSCAFHSNLVPDGQTNFSGAVAYSSALSMNYGNAAINGAAHYPAGATPSSANLAFAAFGSDLNFICRARRVDNWLVTNNPGKVFAYELNEIHTQPVNWKGATLHDGSTFPTGAFHGADLFYVFTPPVGANDACATKVKALSPAQKSLEIAVQTYWATFAKTGTPNPLSGAKPPNWPAYNATLSGKMMSLVSPNPVTMKASLFAADHQCPFWDSNSP